MKCFDTKNGDFEVEQVRVTTGSGDIFFRRRISRNDDGSISAVSAEMEVITQCQDAAAALEELAEKNGEAVQILSGIEDGGFHAILGPEVMVSLMPQNGTMMFLLGEKVDG